MSDDSALFRRVVSFARRDGRILRRHAKAWDEEHAPFRLEVPRSERQVSVHPDWRLDVAQTYGREAPLVVEVGSGTGEALLEAAAADPDRNYLGLEVYKPGVARTIVHAARRELRNLKVAEVDAAEFLATAVPSGAVDELRVFFPDPWHKQRHHKRRLVSEEFSGVAAQALREGGIWWLATDWAEYADHMRRAIDSVHWELTVRQVRTPAGHAAVAAAREGRCLTRFERKALAAGRSVTDLVYVRTHAAATPEARSGG